MGRAEPEGDGPSLVLLASSEVPRLGLWGHRAGHALTSGPSALPTEEILPELVSSGIQPLVQEIKERFTSSLVSISRGPQTRPPTCFYSQIPVALSPGPRTRGFV